MNVPFFEHPEYVWAFGLVALAALLIGFYFRWKAKLIKALGDETLVKSLMVGFSWPRQMVRAGLYLAALGLLTAGLLNLQKPVQDGNAGISGLDVMFVLDVSNSMMARDVAPNRLEKSKLLISRLADTLQGNRVGIVAFAGQAFLQLPLTTDISAARMYISSVNTQAVPLQGTDIQQALQVAAESMPAAEKKYKAMLLITDGEEHDTKAIEKAAELKNDGIMLVTIGVGTPNGGSVTGVNGETIFDDNSQPVVSRLNEKLLNELAAKTNGKYLHLDDVNLTLAAIKAELGSMDQKAIINSQLVNYRSYSHWMIGLALLLLLFQMWLGEKTKTAKEKSNLNWLSVGKPAMALWLLVFMSLGAMAQNTGNQVRKGNSAYREGRLGDAELFYKNVLDKDSANTTANFQLANIGYKRKDYGEAINGYNKVLGASEKSEEAVAGAWNNKGLTYVQQKNLPKAIEAFKQAVRTNPYDTEIRDNLNLALKEWQKQMQQPQPKNEKPDKQKNKFNQKQAEDRLQALQQEEKRIREQMNRQKQNAKTPGSKDW